MLVLFSLQATSFPIPPFNGPSLRWYEAVLGDARLTSALVNSLLVAVISSLVAVALGFLAAWGFARFMLPGSALLRGLITLPLTVSYLIIGMGLLVLFNCGRPAEIAARRRHRPCRDQPAALLCHHLQPDGRPPGQHRARRPRPRRAGMAGAVLVTVPCMWPALFAGFFLSMTFSWDEFVIAFLLTRFDTTLAGRDLEPAALRPQPEDQCGRLAGLRRLRSCWPSCSSWMLLRRRPA